ncbi:MAG: hypothetical protein OXI53_11395 [Nitrospira sp.]|nr:hypothetical protein [Nitrospira sp.]
MRAEAGKKMFGQLNPLMKMAGNGFFRGLLPGDENQKFLKRPGLRQFFANGDQGFIGAFGLQPRFRRET